MEAVSALTIDGITQAFELGTDPTRESRHPQAQNFCVKTATGEYLAVHLSSSQKFWPALCTAMNRMDLTEDPRFAEYRPREANYFELVKIVEAEFEQKSKQHWEEVLTTADVPFAPVLPMTGYLEHEQVKWLELVEPQADGLALIRPLWRFDGERPDRRGTAPKVGADSRDVDAEVYPADKVDELIEAGVLFES
jgi:crotonobetainyl-CoA:carnitine CoA-transferase CaiB-like acyl-CoA transferase